MPRQKWDEALGKFVERVQSSLISPQAVSDVLGRNEVEERPAGQKLDDEIEDALLQPIGLKFVSPNSFEEKLWRACCVEASRKVGEIRVPLSKFLRKVYDGLQIEHGWRRRLNVVPGPNFDRALTWVREAEEEWSVAGGTQALRLVRSHRGRLPAQPNPGSYVAITSADFFRED